MEKFRYIDLFAGTGVISYILSQYENTECVFANDILSESKKIYELNNSCKLTLGDLSNIPVESIPKHHLLIAGFPCQPFSTAGKKLGSKILVQIRFG